MKKVGKIFMIILLICAVGFITYRLLNYEGEVPAPSEYVGKWVTKEGEIISLRSDGSLFWKTKELNYTGSYQFLTGKTLRITLKAEDVELPGHLSFKISGRNMQISIKSSEISFEREFTRAGK